jgi:hypothetical protein
MRWGMIHRKKGVVRCPPSMLHIYCILCSIVSHVGFLRQWVPRPTDARAHNLRHAFSYTQKILVPPPELSLLSSSILGLPETCYIARMHSYLQNALSRKKYKNREEIGTCRHTTWYTIARTSWWRWLLPRISSGKQKQFVEIPNRGNRGEAIKFYCVFIYCLFLIYHRHCYFDYIFLCHTTIYFIYTPRESLFPNCQKIAVGWCQFPRTPFCILFKMTHARRRNDVCDNPRWHPHTCGSKFSHVNFKQSLISIWSLWVDNNRVLGRLVIKGKEAGEWWR